MAKNKKILIIQTAFIGDVILTLPLIKAVYDKYPGCSISLMITPKAYDLVKANPYINEIIIYDKNGRDKGVKQFLKFAKEIRKKKYSLAVLPHRSLRSAMLAYSGKITERTGFDRSAGKMLLTKVIKYSWEKHEVDRNLDLIGGKQAVKGITLHLDAEDIKKAGEFLSVNGITEKDLLIGIAPGSVWATKRWLKERFAELSKKINDVYGAKIILFGGKEDEGLSEEIKNVTGKILIIAAGQLSLGVSASVISKCRCFITNDTAPLHIASAFQIPTVAIFGPTVTNLGFGPYGVLNAVIEKKLPCRPCGRHGHMECPKGHFKCMKGITVDEVFEACGRLIK